MIDPTLVLRGMFTRARATRRRRRCRATPPVSTLKGCRLPRHHRGDHDWITDP